MISPKILRLAAGLLLAATLPACVAYVPAGPVRPGYYLAPAPRPYYYGGPYYGGPYYGRPYYGGPERFRYRD